MLIHNAQVTGSLILNGIDIGDITGSEVSIGALNSFSASVNIYTGSNNTNINALQTFSSSILTYTASNDTTNNTQNSRLSSLETTSGSLLTASGSFSTRVSNTETTSSNLTTASSSFSTRVANNEATGSGLVAASASFSTRVANTEATASSLTTASGSFSTRTTNLETASGSFSTRVTNNESNISSLTTASGSFSTRTTNLETASGSFSTRVTNAESNITSLNSKTGSYATTGSNIFVGAQYISNISNAISFTSTGSLYTDGGMRVAKDMYVSGTAYFNNVTVFGTQSIAYISSSQLNIGTNIISVNTDTPSIRFGGLSVYDSGSTGLTGSMLWDSEDNQWIYSNPSGSTYDSAVFLVGPRNSGAIGSEVGISCNFLSKGNGLHHMTSSAIFENGSVTCIPNTLVGGIINSSISTTSTACSTLNLISGCVGIGGINPSNPLHIYTNVNGHSTAIKIHNGSACAGATTGIEFELLTDYCDYKKAEIRAVAASQYANEIDLAFWSGGSTAAKHAERLRITSDGISCFACQVCAPSFVGGTLSGTTIYGSTAVCSPVGLFSGCVGIGTTSPATPLHLTTSLLPAIRLTLGSEARVHNISGVNNGRDLNISPFRHFSVQTGNGITEGQIVLNAYEDFIVGTGASYTSRFSIASTGAATFSAATQDAIQTVVRMSGNNASSQLKALDFKLTAGTPLWTISTAAVGTDAGINIMPNGSAGLSLTYAGAATFSSTITGTTIYGSTAVCSPVGKFTSCIDAGSGTFSSSVTSNSLIVKNSGIPALQLYRDLDVTVVGTAGQGIEFGARNGASTYVAGGAIYGALDNPATTGLLAFQTLTAGSLTTKLTIVSTGIACFSNTVCAPAFVSSGTITANQGVITNISGLNVGGYNLYTQTVSGAMGILGHNVRANGSIANQVDVVNSGWISSMIKQYYNEGITFHTSPTMYNAGDIFPMDTTRRLRIGPDGVSCFSSTVCASSFNSSASSTLNGLVVSCNVVSNCFTGITVVNSAGGGSDASRAGIAFQAYDWVQSAIWHGRQTSAAFEGALLFGTNPNTANLGVGGVCTRLRIDNNGIATFSCQVCAPVAIFSGCVGIGTTTPTEMLHLNSGNTASFIRFQNTGGSGTYIGSRNANIEIYTGGSEKLRITSDGSFAIGTTAPRAILSVEQDYAATAEFGSQGQLSISGKTNPEKRLSMGFNTSADVGFIQAMVNGVSYNNLLLNARGGNVGIGTASPSYLLDVSGPMRAGTILASNATTTTWCVGRINDAKTDCWYSIFGWNGIYDGAFAIIQLGYEDNNGDGANTHALWMTTGAAYSTGFSTSLLGGAGNLCTRRNGQCLEALITGVTCRAGGAFLGFTVQSMNVAS